ncbi:MAG TPA: putative transporter small subunit [Kiloniellales bacterium]|jgi:hypothetical protein|nr:putative transporter small subunit [Kiloniellales bacterium]
MTTFWLTFYILIWPALSAIILSVIVRGFFRDLNAARKAGVDIV